jgi:hypothetical protein
LDDLHIQGVSVIGAYLGRIQIDLEVDWPSAGQWDLGLPERDVLPLGIGGIDDASDEHSACLSRWARGGIGATEDRDPEARDVAVELDGDIDQTSIAVIPDEQQDSALRIDTSCEFLGDIERSTIDDSNLVASDGDDDVLGFDSRLLGD